MAALLQFHLAGNSLKVAQASSERKRGTVSHNTAVIQTQDQRTCVEKLAQLFPDASPVRIGVKVSMASVERSKSEEQAVIEFATAREVLFQSNLPLEFEDHIRLANANGSLDVKAKVIAMQYQEGSKAVAARFANEVGNWIVRP